MAWFPLQLPGAYVLRALSWAHVRVWGAAGRGCHTPAWPGSARFVRSSYVNRALLGISTSAEVRQRQGLSRVVRGGGRTFALTLASAFAGYCPGHRLCNPARIFMHYRLSRLKTRGADTPLHGVSAPRSGLCVFGEHTPLRGV